MNIIYTSYFQKSKVFLYPLLGFKKNIEFVPADTFICWDEFINVLDYKFICVYKCEMTLDFKNFETKYLKSHRLLKSYYNLADKQIYVFNFKSYKYDFDQFINGHYSKFSLKSKDLILTYFSEYGKISEYIKSFLDPGNYHEIYAENLGVNINLIREVHEICSKPDFEKECLKEKILQEKEISL